jgi:hypothetical protein
MLKENTVITLHPEDIFRLNAILLDEDKEATLDCLGELIKKKADRASKPHCRPIFELEWGKTQEFITKRLGRKESTMQKKLGLCVCIGGLFLLGGC